MKADTVRRFENLVVWQKTHALVLRLYRVTADFAKAELDGLTSQMRRAAISVPANIAAGFKKHGRDDKLRFRNIAQGSLEEVRDYQILARDLGYTVCEDGLAAVDEVSRLLEAYLRGIRRAGSPDRQ